MYVRAPPSERKVYLNTSRDEVLDNDTKNAKIILWDESKNFLIHIPIVMQRLAGVARFKQEINLQAKKCSNPDTTRFFLIAMP